MNLTLKNSLNALLPAPLRPRALTRRHLESATKAGVILGGPFAGMRYVRDAVGSMWWPKILGTYEQELAATVARLCLARPARVIDVGAAEGYYAVGLAWRCPETQVIAFEGEPAGRQLQAELAALNGVAARVRIEGFCDHTALRLALAGADSGLIICDIEGGERELLDPALIPALSSGAWTLLVEIHDHIAADIASVLTTRFQATHSTTEIVSLPRHARDLPAAARSQWLTRWTLPYLDERRPGPMRWLLFQPTLPGAPHA